LRVARKLLASPERVFDAWLDPAIARKWLFTTQESEIVTAEIEARVGGRFRFVDRRATGDIEHVGEYLAIERPHQLVFTFGVPRFSAEMTKVTVVIKPAEHGCELLLVHEGVPAEWQERTQEGWGMLLGRLVDRLDSTRPPGQAIVLERILPQPPDLVWAALTSPGLIARWLMPNDFRPELGHSFTLQARTIGAWDGVVHCKVLEIEPPRRLRYSWVGGSAENAAHGSRLDSIVIWTLAPVAGGTRLTMAHEGFGPGNESAYAAMSGGWVGVLTRLEQVSGAV
jgi:uncharacterized protein YndB with AHSA1/START domain